MSSRCISWQQSAYVNAAQRDPRKVNHTGGSLLCPLRPPPHRRAVATRALAGFDNVPGQTAVGVVHPWQSTQKL